MVRITVRRGFGDRGQGGHPVGYVTKSTGGLLRSVPLPGAGERYRDLQQGLFLMFRIAQRVRDRLSLIPLPGARESYGNLRKGPGSCLNVGNTAGQLLRLVSESGRAIGLGAGYQRCYFSHRHDPRRRANQCISELFGLVGEAGRVVRITVRRGFGDRGQGGHPVGYVTKSTGGLLRSVPLPGAGERYRDLQQGLFLMFRIAQRVRDRLSLIPLPGARESYGNLRKGPGSCLNVGNTAGQLLRLVSESGRAIGLGAGYQRCYFSHRHDPRRRANQCISELFGLVGEAGRVVRITVRRGFGDRGQGGHPVGYVTKSTGGLLRSVPLPGAGERYRDLQQGLFLMFRIAQRVRDRLSLPGKADCLAWVGVCECCSELALRKDATERYREALD